MAKSKTATYRSVSFPAEVYSELQRIATAEDRTVQSVILRAVRAGLVSWSAPSGTSRSRG